MIPPGIPDFFTRRRYVDSGRVVLHGRAWSGHGGIERVEVGVDGGWADARLHPVAGTPPGGAGRSPGTRCEASTARLPGDDAAGNVQPLAPPWNYQGMGNNLVQRVAVTAR